MPLIRRIGGGALTPDQRENLARGEHLRWCAFHYIFGLDVRPVDWNELDSTPHGENSMSLGNHGYKDYDRSTVDVVTALMLDAEEKG